MKIVLWGLNKGNDSFRHIYLGLYKNYLHMGKKIYWVADEKKSATAISAGDLVIATDRGAENLSLVSGAKYFTLNLDKKKGIGKRLWEYENSYYMQEYTIDAFGTPDSRGSVCLYAPDVRTIFLPWGTPVFEENFSNFNDAREKSKMEYFVGSIWDNPEGQGNKTSLREYSRVLAKAEIKFKRIGGNRWGRKGISDEKSHNFVQQSRLGAAIVGNWQSQNKYYPCRLFKAISSGMPPISNLDASAIFSDAMVYDHDIEILTNRALSQSSREARLRFEEAKLITLKHYTYKAMISRISRVVTNEW